MTFALQTLTTLCNDAVLQQTCMSHNRLGKRPLLRVTHSQESDPDKIKQACITTECTMGRLHNVTQADIKTPHTPKSTSTQRLTTNSGDGAAAEWSCKVMKSWQSGMPAQWTLLPAVDPITSASSSMSLIGSQAGPSCKQGTHTAHTRLHSIKQLSCGISRVFKRATSHNNVRKLMLERSSALVHAPTIIV